jgi:hypothetical protein
MENEVNLDEQMQLIDEAMENCQKALQKEDTTKSKIKNILTCWMPTPLRSHRKMQYQFLSLSLGLLGVQRQLIQILQYLGQKQKAEGNKKGKDCMYG